VGKKEKKPCHEEDCEIARQARAGEKKEVGEIWWEH
jgi:hypothetical protein